MSSLVKRPQTEALDRAAQKLNALIEKHLDQLDPEERTKTHRAAMDYAAKALESPRAKRRAIGRTKVSRPVSRNGE